MFSRLASYSAICALLGACSTERLPDDRTGSPDSDNAVYDSAGIRIVVHAASAGPPRFLLEGPRVVLGTTEGAELVRTIAAVRQPDGQVVVADAGRNELLLFDSTGALVRTLGRAGGGPGEFRDLTWVGRHGSDSIAVYDFRLSRLSIFVDSGFVRSTPITPSEHMSPLAARPVGLLADGRSIFAGGAAIALGDPGPARIERDSRPIVYYDAGGAPRQLIGTFPGAELEVTPITSGPLRGRGFVRNTRIFGRGSAVVLSGSYIVVADNATFKLDFHDETGRLVQSIRWQLVQDSVRSAEVQAYIAERSARIRNATARANLEQALQAATPSPTYPAFEPEVIVDPTGSLWVGEYRRPDATEQRWWAFDSAGALVREVAVPRGLAVRDAGPDYIVGVWRDADGVESVRVYGLESADGGQPARR